jgi:hypothetical protein
MIAGTSSEMPCRFPLCRRLHRPLLLMLPVIGMQIMAKVTTTLFQMLMPMMNIGHDDGGGDDDEVDDGDDDDDNGDDGNDDGEGDGGDDYNNDERDDDDEVDDTDDDD